MAAPAAALPIFSSSAAPSTTAVLCMYMCVSFHLCTRAHCGRLVAPARGFAANRLRARAEKGEGECVLLDHTSCIPCFTSLEAGAMVYARCIALLPSGAAGSSYSSSSSSSSRRRDGVRERERERRDCELRSLPCLRSMDACSLKYRASCSVSEQRRLLTAPNLSRLHGQANKTEQRGSVS